MRRMIGPADDPTRLQQAHDFAKLYHADQRRKDGSTVFAHALAVTENLRDAGVRDVDVLIAGLLHDVVEQTPVTTAEIEARFGPRVSTLVEAVTCLPGMSTEESALRAAAAGEDALLLRLCDRLDGVRRSVGRPPEDARRFRAEARRVHLPIARERFPEVARALEEALEACEG